MKTQTTDKATAAARPLTIHHEKLTVAEPFVTIQENRDDFTNQIWLREIPVSNIQDRNGSVSVKFMGGWYPLASQRDIEHAALVAVADIFKCLATSPRFQKMTVEDALTEMNMNDCNASLAFATLAAVRKEVK